MLADERSWALDLYAEGSHTSHPFVPRRAAKTSFTLRVSDGLTRAGPSPTISMLSLHTADFVAVLCIL
jgi:hypothetical protein